MIRKNARSNGVFSVELSPDEITKIDLIYLKGKSMVSWYSKQIIKPRFMINTSLFHWENFSPIGTVKINGEWINNDGNGWGFGIYDGNKFEFNSPWAKSYNDYYTGYYGYIKNGIGIPNGNNSVMRGYSKRSFLAEKNGNLFLGDISSCTGEQAKSKLQNMKFVNAINNDGGGSSLILEWGVPINNPTENSRPISCCLAVYTKSGNYVPVTPTVPTTPVVPIISTKEDESMDYKVICKLKTLVFNEDGVLQPGYVSPNDVCILNSNLNYNLLAKITYPTSKGNKTAYIKDIKNFKIVN